MKVHLLSKREFFMRRRRDDPKIAWNQTTSSAAMEKISTVVAIGEIIQRTIFLL